MKKLIVIVLLLCLFFALHCYTEWRFDNDPPEGMMERFDNWASKLGQTQITDDETLIGERITGEDNYVGYYLAECDEETGKDVIFGGGSVEGRSLYVSGRIQTESGEATVRIRMNDEVTELPIDGNGHFETELNLSSGGNYIMVKYENFKGTVEIESEYKEKVASQTV